MSLQKSNSHGSKSSLVDEKSRADPDSSLSPPSSLSVLRAPPLSNSEAASTSELLRHKVVSPFLLARPLPGLLFDEPLFIQEEVELDLLKAIVSTWAPPLQPEFFFGRLPYNSRLSFPSNPDSLIVPSPISKRILSTVPSASSPSISINQSFLRPKIVLRPDFLPKGAFIVSLPPPLSSPASLAFYLPVFVSSTDPLPPLALGYSSPISAGRDCPVLPSPVVPKAPVIATSKPNVSVMRARMMMNKVPVATGQAALPIVISSPEQQGSEASLRADVLRRVTSRVSRHEEFKEFGSWLRKDMGQSSAGSYANSFRVLCQQTDNLDLIHILCHALKLSDYNLTPMELNLIVYSICHSRSVAAEFANRVATDMSQNYFKRLMASQLWVPVASMTLEWPEVQGFSFFPQDQPPRLLLSSLPLPLASLPFDTFHSAALQFLKMNNKQTCNQTVSRMALASLTGWSISSLGLFALLPKRNFNRRKNSIPTNSNSSAITQNTSISHSLILGLAEGQSVSSLWTSILTPLEKVQPVTRTISVSSQQQSLSIAVWGIGNPLVSTTLAPNLLHSSSWKESDENE
eukprot:GDKJ01048976.1.p1 GENE.GDKJ01048976.1~~GDKJ01048976.1.p1  ORF type:complete len:574 (+),score=131.05 GDKJ01048976.1:545-2266(+)